MHQRRKTRYKVGDVVWVEDGNTVLGKGKILVEEWCCGEEYRNSCNNLDYKVEGLEDRWYHVESLHLTEEEAIKVVEEDIARRAAFIKKKVPRTEKGMIDMLTSAYLAGKGGESEPNFEQLLIDYRLSRFSSYKTFNPGEQV